MSAVGAAVGNTKSTAWSRLQCWTDHATNAVALVGVAGMLIGAGAVVFDALARSLAGGGVRALNEIVSMSFAVAVAACIPAGLSRGVGITIDILEGNFSPWMAAWLRTLGSALVALFFALLAWEVGRYAAELAGQQRTTVILGLPQAPFIWTVSLLLAVSTLVQLLVAANAGVDAARGTTLSRPNTWDMAGLVMVLAVLVLTIVGWSIFPQVARWAQLHPALTVLIAFGALWFFLFGLLPLAAVVGLSGLVGSALFIGFAPSASALATETVGFLTNYQVATLPLFLMMGSFAAVAGIADDVYRLAQALLGRFRGGLAMATIGGCAGFGAVTGSSLATVATFGRIALPQMQAHRYAPHFAVGCVAAGGTLGALIPPSAPLIIFALLTEASIGQLFVAAIVPGLIAAALYIVAIAIAVRINPDLAPATEKVDQRELWVSLARCGPAALLFGSVIGGMYSGICTATEAAAVGAVGAFLVALVRGRLGNGRLWAVMGETVTSTALIYSLIFGVVIFSFFVAASALPEKATAFVGALDLHSGIIIALILVVFLLLGAVMDSFTVMIITIPIITPIVSNMGYDILWWGIINLVVVEIGLVTPPFGLHLFLLKGMLDKVSLEQIYRGVLPFCLVDMLRLGLLVMLPVLTLWLPMRMLAAP